MSKKNIILLALVVTMAFQPAQAMNLKENLWAFAHMCCPGCCVPEQDETVSCNDQSSALGHSSLTSHREELNYTDLPQAFEWLLRLPSEEEMQLRKKNEERKMFLENYDINKDLESIQQDISTSDNECKATICNLALQAQRMEVLECCRENLLIESIVLGAYQFGYKDVITNFLTLWFNEGDQHSLIEKFKIFLQFKCFYHLDTCRLREQNDSLALYCKNMGEYCTTMHCFSNFQLPNHKEQILFFNENSLQVMLDDLEDYPVYVRGFAKQNIIDHKRQYVMDVNINHEQRCLGWVKTAYNEAADYAKKQDILNAARMCKHDTVLMMLHFNKKFTELSSLNNVQFDFD